MNFQISPPIVSRFLGIRCIIQAIAKTPNVEEDRVTCCVTIVCLGASHWVD